MPITVRASGERKAEVLVYGSIGDDPWGGESVTAKGFIEDLKALGALDEILVRINSPGGAVTDGVAIYNALRAAKAKVTTQIDAAAYSIASIIAMAGDQIVMASNALMMIHDPWTLAMGNAEDMRRAAEVLDKHAEVLVDTYASRTGLEAGRVRELMKAETWMSADEAVSMGFATSKIEALAVAASFDLSRFRNVPGSLKAHNQEIQTMPTPASPSAGADTKAIEATAAAEALKAEAARRAEIRAIFKGHEQRELLDACLDDTSCSVDAAGRKLLARLAEGAQPTAARVSVEVDARDKFRVAAQRALDFRAKVGDRDPGNEFNGMSLHALAGHALILAGHNVRGLTPDGIARKVLAAHSTSDFPSLLANTAGKSLLASFQMAPVTWSRWCKKGSVSDFKAISRVRMGSFSSLQTIPELGEYKEGTLTEEAETITAATKGRKLSLSRQMIVNDDLGGFVDRAGRMGWAAARTVDKDVYTSLTSNSGAGPTMSDGGALFNATAITSAGGHANLASSGSAISVASISAGEAAMAKQKDKSLEDFLAITPRFLLCSVEKKQTAWEVMNSLTDVSQSNPQKKNYVQDQLKLEVVASPNLSALPWYLLADPMEAPVYEVAFLDGVETPYIDETIDFFTDALAMKVRLDYGVAPQEWRGGYRNPGA